MTALVPKRALVRENIVQIHTVFQKPNLATQRQPRWKWKECHSGRSRYIDVDKACLIDRATYPQSSPLPMKVQENG